MRRLVPLALLFAGCSWFEPPITCADPDRVIAAGEVPLTCAQALRAERYVEVLAARPVDPRRLFAALKAAHGHDPQAVHAALAEADRALASLEGTSGLEGAEERSRLAWRETGGEGALGPLDGEVRAAVGAAIAVWARDDDTGLVLSEADMEGWIRYASLAREVQGAAPLRLSVADRVEVYRMVRDRFEAADREGQVALAAIGPYWREARDRWRAATYEEQQAWIAAAPLPPPMTATSLAYLEAVLETSPVAHARAFHDVLGPFSLEAS